MIKTPFLSSPTLNVRCFYCFLRFLEEISFLLSICIVLSGLQHKMIYWLYNAFVRPTVVWYGDRRRSRLLAANNSGKLQRRMFGFDWSFQVDPTIALETSQFGTIADPLKNGDKNKCLQTKERISMAR